MPKWIILAIILVMLIATKSFDSRMDTLENEQVKAIIHKDGSAQVFIGDVVCGLPPISNQVARARCHE